MSTARARALRKLMPKAEQRLWQLLRRKQLDGFRFRRQHPVPPYFLDFFCFTEQLAIELDGWQHHSDEARAYDAARTAFIAVCGITVIRFTNEDLFAQPDQVIDAIHQALQERRRARNGDPS
ncbi:MAG: DUF559 domain-containing protein [Micropepsaceae bacterium]